MRRGILLLAALLACGRTERSDDGHRHAEQPPESMATRSSAEEPGRNVLRIVPEMLRDLRITTAPVEERGGSEGVSVLGELGANEDAYAVVGSPVAARIRRMLARPGETVRAGQALAELESVELGRARAELLAARARLDLAQRTLRRTRGLAAERIAPRRELEEAEAKVTTAQAEVGAAQAALGALGVREEGSDARPGRAGASSCARPSTGRSSSARARRGKWRSPSAPSIAWATSRACR